MATTMVGFPFANIVDGLLSFIQFVFSQPDSVPSHFRWNVNDRESRIRISGAYVSDNEKPSSRPYIIVERSGLVFANRTMDNLESATANTLTSPKHRDWADGLVNITCGSEVAAEASSLANFLAIYLQANRHKIISTLKFMRHFISYDIGPEVPTKGTIEKRRWEVSLRFKCSVYMGWILREESTIPFDKASFRSIHDEDTHVSTTGELASGSYNLVDASADFGNLTTNDPQLLSAELEKKWYYVQFDDDPYNKNDRLYPIKEIVDNNTIWLLDKDINDSEINFNPGQNDTGVGYKILWNSVHIHVELPTS